MTPDERARLRRLVTEELECGDTYSICRDTLDVLAAVPALLDALEEAERSASIWRVSAERTAENATAREVALEADLASVRRERDEARADADALRALIACSSVRPVLT